MTISIITATLNEGERLNHALASVAEQSYDDIEHIVVDGMSTDNSIDIIRRYPNVTLYEQEPLGVWNALNFGMHKATGDVIGLLHGNDRMAAPNVIEQVAQAFIDDPELDLIFGDVLFTKEVNGVEHPTRLYTARGFEPSQMVNGIVPPHPSLYMRREVAEKIGDYTTSYRIAGDFDYWLRLFKDKSLRYRYLPLTIVKMSSDGISNRWNNRLFWNIIEKLHSLHCHGYRSQLLLFTKKYVSTLKQFYCYGRK
jgi:glycosyltransferase